MSEYKQSDPRPPQEFVDSMSELGIAIDLRDYRQSGYWQCWVKGYNAAVNKHNDNVSKGYGMDATAKRVLK